MYKKRQYFWLILITGVVLFSCGRQPLAQVTKPLDSGIWPFKDSVCIAVKPNSITVPTNFRLKLEVTDDYEFSNLYIKYLIKEVNESKVTTSIVEYLLADSLGNWFVEQGLFSGVRAYENIVARNIQFDPKKEYQICLKQYMRVDELKGIKKISFLIEPLEE